MKGTVFAGVVLVCFGGAAWAADHGISSDEVEPLPYAMAGAEGYREICEQMEWGFGGIRTECRTRPLPPRPVNPALKGICLTYYGDRTCY